MGPDLAGFLDYVRNAMDVPASALPDDSPYLQPAFDFALAVVNPLLAAVPSPATSASIYARAVYGLAADALANGARDVTGKTYFKDLRTQLNLAGFKGGVITASGDEGTNESMVVPDFVKGLTFMNLQQLKTPWGRDYLSIAQSYGGLVGLT